MRWFRRTAGEDPLPDIRYANSDHEAFNLQLEKQKSIRPPARDLNDDWMSPEVRLKLPKVASAFETALNRRSALAAEDRGTPTKRTDGGGSETGEGKAQNEADQPKPALRPKGPIRAQADRAAKEDHWLANHRDVVMESAKLPAQTVRDQSEYNRMNIGIIS